MKLFCVIHWAPFLWTFVKSGSDSSAAVSASVHATTPINNALEGFMLKKRMLMKLTLWDQVTTAKRRVITRLPLKKRKAIHLNHPYLQWKAFLK